MFFKYQHDFNQWTMNKNQIIFLIVERRENITGNKGVEDNRKTERNYHHHLLFLDAKRSFYSESLD